MTWKPTGILKRLLKSSLELTIIHNLINNSLISMPQEFQMELKRCWNKLRGKLLRKLNPWGKTKSSLWEDSTKKLGLTTKRRNLELGWRKNLLDSRDCLVLQGKMKELRKQQLFIPNNLARLPWDLITLSRNKSSSMLSMRIISKLLEIRLWATNSWTKTKPSSKEKFKDLNKKMDIHTMSNLMVTFKDMVLDKDIQLVRSVNSVRVMVEAIQPILNSLILQTTTNHWKELWGTRSQPYRTAFVVTSLELIWQDLEEVMKIINIFINFSIRENKLVWKLSDSFPLRLVDHLPQTCKDYLNTNQSQRLNQSSKNQISDLQFPNTPMHQQVTKCKNSSLSLGHSGMLLGEWYCVFSIILFLSIYVYLLMMRA